MLINCQQVSDSDYLEFDICIVGAGAAGITLAKELSNKGLNIAVFESGSLKDSKQIQDLSKAKVDPEFHAPVELNQYRCLGGNTTKWAGRCIRFDEIDFQHRSWVPYSGWCINSSDLEPYYFRAHKYLELGDYNYELKESLPNYKTSLIEGAKFSNLTINNLYRFSPPTNFQKYLSDLKEVKIFYNATCRQIVYEDSKVVNLEFISSAPNSPAKKISVKSKYYVLAMGGIENAKILMLSGFKNKNVVKFYQSHLVHYLELKLFKDIIQNYEKSKDGIWCQRSISLTSEFQEKYKILNHRMFIERTNPEDSNHQVGYLSLINLLKYRNHKQLAQHFKNIIVDPLTIINYGSKMLASNLFIKSKIPVIVLKNKSNWYRLRIDVEQAPNPSSQIILSQEKDALDIPRVKIDWQYNNLDVSTIFKLIEILNETFLNNKIGEIRSVPEINFKANIAHFIGTTRMSITPTEGVVNHNCQVHGLSNLLIAGSSVFPTSSFANPTLTIVAMTIRLSDHLKELFQWIN
ncbi:MAG TPA: hypothetical protein DCF68_04115 [Cyanothece sp. UBA12306]|nr:hypothetical protein [Cyanothece sp. UBA12306]